MSIEIGGMEELKRVLAGWGGVQKQRRALELAGEMVRADAAMNCPVDTSRLKQSITSTVEGDSALVGTNVEYMICVEFGTGSKGDPSLAHTTKSHWTYYKEGHFYTTSGQVPQPFLVPALKNNKDRIIHVFKEVYAGD